MGWKETSVVEERFKFIQEHQSGDWSVAELCRQYGVSRKTGYKWLERYGEKGLEGLRDQSRAPLQHRNEVVVEVADAIIDLRRQHPLWGPEKLNAWLQRNAPEVVWPAPSTIGELIIRRGMTVPPKRHRRVGPSLNPLSHAEAANQIWCIDFKGWCRSGDGRAQRARCHGGCVPRVRVAERSAQRQWRTLREPRNWRPEPTIGMVGETQHPSGKDSARQASIQRQA